MHSRAPSGRRPLFRSAEPNITDQTCLPFALSRLVLHTRCPAEQGRPPVGQGGEWGWAEFQAPAAVPSPFDHDSPCGTERVTLDL